jgi:hypothetical protein
VLLIRREEAVALLKEVTALCDRIEPNHVLLKSSRKSAESEGFAIHIKDNFSEADWKCVKTIVEKRGLSIREHNGYIIIYEQKNK